MSSHVFVRGLAAAGIAAAGDVLIFLLARGAGISFDVPVPLVSGSEMPWYVIAVVAAGGAIAGAVFAWQLGRRNPRIAARFFTWTVVAVALLSCVPLLALGLAAGSTAALVAMHILPGAVVLAVLLPVLRREAARVAL